MLLLRVFCVRAGNRLPAARLLGRNQLARFIPKTVPPAIRSNGDGPGLDRRGIVANFDSRGERFLPSSCRFNRGCQVLQNWAISARCRSMRASPTDPNLDVTHSGKVTFTRKIPRLTESMTGEWPWRLVRGNSSVMASPAQPPIRDPKSPVPARTHRTSTGDRPRDSRNGRPPGSERSRCMVATLGSSGELVRLNWHPDGVVTSGTDDEVVAAVPKQTHRGSIYVLRGGLASKLPKFVPIGLDMDGGTGKLVPGRQVHLLGSGFGSQPGPGYITAGDAQAVVVSSNSAEIILIVPESVPGRVYKVSIDRSGPAFR